MDGMTKVAEIQNGNIYIDTTILIVVGILLLLAALT